jgi:hypothetical protein
MIPWPYAMIRGGRRLVICGDLLRALYSESWRAVAHHLGVSLWAVRGWRSAGPCPLDLATEKPRSAPPSGCELIGTYSSLVARPGDRLHCERVGEVIVVGTTGIHNLRL